MCFEILLPGEELLAEVAAEAAALVLRDLVLEEDVALLEGGAAVGADVASDSMYFLKRASGKFSVDLQ